MFTWTHKYEPLLLGEGGCRIIWNVDTDGRIRSASVFWTRHRFLQLIYLRLDCHLCESPFVVLCGKKGITPRSEPAQKRSPLRSNDHELAQATAPRILDLCPCWKAMCSWKKTAQGRKNSRLLTTAFRTSELDAKLTNDHDQFVDMKAKKKSSLLWIIHEVKADRVLRDGFYCLMLSLNQGKSHQHFLQIFHLGCFCRGFM